MIVINFFATIVYKIRTGIVNKISEWGELTYFFVHSMFLFFSKWHVGFRLRRNIIAKQILFTAYDGLPVIGVASFFMGTILIFIFKSNMHPLMSVVTSNNDLISDILIKAIVQYLGPLLTTIILIGRSGTAIAAELGNMRVNHETEALETMGINLYHFIIAPRIIGMIVSMVILTIFFDAIGIAGGTLVAVAVIENFDVSQFLNSFFNTLSLTALLDGVIKVIGCGAIISTIACYQGLKVQVSSTEVPRASTKAVVQSLIFSLLFFAYISVIFLI